MIATMIVTSVRVKPACALSRVAIPVCTDIIGLPLLKAKWMPNKYCLPTLSYIDIDFNTLRAI